jgi:hypothetical protein
MNMLRQFIAERSPPAPPAHDVDAGPPSRPTPPPPQTTLASTTSSSHSTSTNHAPATSPTSGAAKPPANDSCAPSQQLPPIPAQKPLSSAIAHHQPQPPACRPPADNNPQYPPLNKPTTSPSNRLSPTSPQKHSASTNSNLQQTHSSGELGSSVSGLPKGGMTAPLALGRADTGAMVGMIGSQQNQAGHQAGWVAFGNDDTSLCIGDATSSEF